MGIAIRHAEASDDGRVLAVVDEWWGGRSMAAMLAKLFFVHFGDTSFVAEADGELAGFLCGCRSQTFAGEADVHVVGVDPGRRAAGLGRALYERFYDGAGRSRVLLGRRLAC
jgi:GNAT superfamily N-acetyltransferase